MDTMNFSLFLFPPGTRLTSQVLAEEMEKCKASLLDREVCPW